MWGITATTEGSCRSPPPHLKGQSLLAAGWATIIIIQMGGAGLSGWGRVGEEVPAGAAAVQGGQKCRVAEKRSSNELARPEGKSYVLARKEGNRGISDYDPQPPSQPEEERPQATHPHPAASGSTHRPRTASGSLAHVCDNLL